uniref:hypothetical protein n=1 Tax=Candidatus Ventrenecus sp. TaxID=3085654 RepID=UPI003FEE5991
MKKKYKKIIIVLVILLFLVFGAFAYCKFFKSRPVDTPIKEVKVTNTIENYGYNLEDRDTKLYKDKYEKLKELLSKDDYDKDEYIKLISELFIIDLYTIDNKISRYDVGGTEFMYTGAVSSFKASVENSLYKTVENDLEDNRSQALPIVSSIEITNYEPTTYEMPDQTVVDGYKVNLSWQYEKDLGYDDTGVLIVIPDGNKMGVVFYKAK